MNAEANKLTILQKDVIILLNEGWCLVTDNSMKGAQVCCNKSNGFHINNGVFFRLVKGGWIHQDSRQHFDYVLTHKAIDWYKQNLNPKQLKEK